MSAYQGFQISFHYFRGDPFQHDFDSPGDVPFII